MPISVESYTAGGIVRGVIARSGPLRDVLESSDRVDIEGAWLEPIEPAAESVPAATTFPVDDLLIVVGNDEPSATIHAIWHRLRLIAGPYFIEGDLPTPPGFDPGRALTRPTGSFVLLRDVRIRLVDGVPGALVERHHALVNRYTVDEFAADLMLGTFFPGARYTASEEVPASPAPAPGRA